MLVWIQCILYARYIWVDSGLTTVAINFARCACIVVLGAYALHRAFSPRFEKALGWVSIVLMTCGSLLFFVQTMFPALPLTWVAAVCSGVGLAWGGGMWMTFYQRLDIREALLYAFSSLALSTLIGIFIGLVGESTAFFISMLLPMTTFVMYRQAHHVLDARASVGIELAPPGDDAYAAESPRTLVRLGAGIALFSFVLGMSRGFPFGASIELPLAFQLVQHLGVAAVGLGIVWWVLVRGRGLKFSVLWQAQLAALAVGVIMLSTLDPLLGDVGATLIAITNLFQVAFLWFVSYDVARHRAVPAYLALGFFWFLHLFFRESGRLVMWWIGGEGGTVQMLVIAVMICLLALSVGFLLTDSIPRVRPLFAELCGSCRLRSLPRVAAGVQPAFEGAGRSPEDSAAVLEVPRAVPATPFAAEPLRVDVVHERFGLTNREAEVLALLAEGRSSSYIADELVLSDNTVRSYVKNIYQKLDVHSKQDLIDFMKQR